MRTNGGTARVSNHNHSLKLLTTEFDDAHEAYDLVEQFLRQKSYNAGFCLKLLSIARQETRAAWAFRRLAVLMLENQVLRLDPSRLDDFDWLLTQLNLKEAPGVANPIVSSILREGFSTTELRWFIPELQRKLERLNRVHNKIRGVRTSEAALRDFIEISRRDCRLSLARYLFTPNEVAEEIRRRLRVSDGVKDLDPSQPRFIDEELSAALNLLPAFEAGILKRLSETSNIYWVSEETSSEINSLVEYPLSTVVLVIKPPGSNLEFEIKRAGRRGRNSLNVVFARNGYTVPPSHRLDGGCMQWLLRYETTSACKLGYIYRHVHGTQAPMPSYVSRTTIYSVPTRGEGVQTLPYFTEPQYFGNGFRQMRVAMAESVSAFTSEGNAELPALPGPLGLSAQFVGHVQPAQSILSGTSSFRLDRLAAYLSKGGPQKYFNEGLSVPFSKRDEKRLADELLEEVLGVYVPADVRYQNYEQYVEAAFALPENRVRADLIYLSLVRQIARFWGTLLGVRGYSRGESFVPRNVGLKSLWEDGDWTVRIIFMDHDALSIPGPGEQIFYVSGALPCMKIDERHIWDRSTPERFSTSEVGYLQSIYRVGKEVAAQSQALEEAESRDAYKKTQQALLTNPKLQPLFNKRFIERLLDWDAVVDGYIQMKRNKLRAAPWKRKMRRILDAKGYKSVTLDCYLEFIEKNWDQLEPYLYLYRAEEKAGLEEEPVAGDLALAFASR
jgi:hypothetical protein